MCRGGRRDVPRHPLVSLPWCLDHLRWLLLWTLQCGRLWRQAMLELESVSTSVTRLKRDGHPGQRFRDASAFTVFGCTTSWTCRWRLHDHLGRHL